MGWTPAEGAAVRLGICPGRQETGRGATVDRQSKFGSEWGASLPQAGPGTL